MIPRSLSLLSQRVAPGRAPASTTLSFRRRPPPCSAHPARRLFWASRKPAFHDPDRDAAEAERLIAPLTGAEPPTHPGLQRAAHLARAAADAGSPRGKTLLGSLHREGLCVPRDADEALRLFRDAAEMGDPVAQCSLAHMSLHRLRLSETDSVDLRPDVSVAVDDAGVQRAGKVDLQTADGVSVVDAQTPAQLVRSVRKARRMAGFADTDARQFEGHKQQREDDRREAARREAHDWLRLAIEQENYTAMVILANDIVHDDPKRALQLFERAAKEDRNTDAYYNIGQLLEQGVNDHIPIDLKASFKNFSMAAQLGDASAQFYMGHLYRTGNFVTDVDNATAKSYIEMAVEQSHPAALYYYALMYRNSDAGVQKDHAKFMQYSTDAADAGHGPALVCLADMYYKGTDGVEVDYVKALDCYTRAGELGEADALCSAAAMHFHGTGTQQDHHRSFQLYQDAVLKESVPAMRNIASMYFYGHGVPVNKKMSQHFMNVADETEKREKERSLQNRKTFIREDAPHMPNTGYVTGTERDLERGG